MTFSILKIFSKTRKMKAYVSMLRAILIDLKWGLAHSSVFFLRVKGSNANLCASFQKAMIDAEVHKKGSELVVAPLAFFFLRGYAVLMDFLDKPNAKIPEDIVERRTLQELLQFLSDTRGSIIRARIRDTDNISLIELSKPAKVVYHCYAMLGCKEMRAGKAFIGFCQQIEQWGTSC